MPKTSSVATAGAAAQAKFEVVIKGSIQDVWHEITRTDAPILAFFNSRMHVSELAPGSGLAMRTPDGKYTAVVGKILECTPPTRFAHTFRFTGYDDPECSVIYDLKEVDGGVRFTLTIVDLPDGTKTAKQMASGGRMIVNTMKSVIETGRPSFGIRLLYVVFKLTAPLTPKKCLSDNWPINGTASRSS